MSDLDRSTTMADLRNTADQMAKEARLFADEARRRTEETRRSADEARRASDRAERRFLVFILLAAAALLAAGILIGRFVEFH